MEKIIIILILLSFFIFIIFVVKKLFKKDNKNINRDEIKNKWKEIENLANFDKEMYYKMAIIEADKLLDNVFKKMGTPGSTMGERLRFLSYKYPKLKTVWDAHIIRNHISHESNYVLYNSSARKAINIYRNALKELNIF